ncbi:MAG: anaerobic ribonucleoside-triphosphate reductase activating protein [Termitinemataceae bacterium]|nr:MAG: anaerobic ribonucleoside-triphosphate reductase activating protein [Termitinemataceae bacterium]
MRTVTESFNHHVGDEANRQRVAFLKTSLVDYPGKLAAVIFFPHCNLRCPWCHNRDLVINTQTNTIPLAEALDHIAKRRSVLGGVVLSGGEPTLVKNLPQIIQHIKALGLAVKLDTNGTNPQILKTLIQTPDICPDYIACDLKIGLARYSELFPAPSPTSAISENIQESIAIIQASTILHEFRSLILPDAYFSEADIAALAPLIKESPWYFRRFIPGSCLDPAWNNKASPTETDLKKYSAYAQTLRKTVIVPT